jgi:hypothetical protein
MATMTRVSHEAGAGLNEALRYAPAGAAQTFRSADAGLKPCATYRPA